MAFIDNIVKFHTFSKSTVRNDLTLGEAVNPSGHTVTSSQVRTDDIPAFINSFQESKSAALTWAAANVDSHVRHNDILYYGANFNMGFNKPSCLIRVAKQVVDGKLVDLPAEQHTWADFDLLSATALANADGKDVIAIHKDAKICYVHTDNNAATNSNQNSAFVKKADGTFLDHFVAPTDQIIGGQPSLGYGLCLFLSGYNNGKAFSEGESTYIGNAYAGLIHFMTTRTESSDKSKNYEVAGFSVNCFEYIGDKLDTTLSNIDEKISQVVGDAFDGAVVSVTADTATQGYGLTVSNDGDDSSYKVITVTPGTIEEAKLVTGSTVKTYIDTVATAEGGTISDAISDAIEAATLVDTTASDKTSIEAATDTTKLVTVNQVTEYVSNYVAENAKITVNDKEGVQDITIKSISQEETKDDTGKVTDLGDIVRIKVSNDETVDGAITVGLRAELEIADWDLWDEQNGFTGTSEENKVLLAGVAQNIVNNTIEYHITEIVGELPNGQKPTIGAAIEQAIKNATLPTETTIADATGEAAAKLVTAAQVKKYVEENAQVTVTVGETEVTSTGFEFEGSTGTDVSVGATMDANGKVTYSATLAKATVNSSTGAITAGGGLAVSASDAEKIATAKAKAEIEAAIADGSTIDTRIDEVLSANTATINSDSTIKTGDESKFVTAGDAEKIADKAVSDSLAGTTTGTIGKAIADVKAIADTAVQSVTSTADSSDLLTVTDGKDVTIKLSTEVATKTDAGTIAAEAITTSLASTAANTIGAAIAAATKAGTDAETIAEGKVADVTVDGTSVVSGDAGSKTAALTTTKGVEITPSATSASTALATEASVAKALASINSVGVSYEVLADGQTHTSVTAPVKGRIYLEKDTTNADAGVYIEWMYTEKGWEQIGSTKTDHSSYASKITINGSEKSVANSAIDLGAFASSVTAGNGVASGSVSATGALSLILTTADTTTAGIVQLTDAYTSTDDTQAATGKSIAAAIATLAATKSVNGITVTQENGVITSITEELITASVPAGTTSVEGNVAFVGSAKHVIAPEKFQTAAQMPTSLTSWVADLSNLTNGDNMFKGCTSLTVFVGDLSALTSGVDMFNGCTLDAESLEILSENLPTVSGGTIDIGAITNATDEVKAEIKGKGWTLKSNGVEI